MPLIPAFQLKLKNTILPNLASIGRFDAKHPSLTCATTAGKIFVHSPHLQTADEGEVKYLNINQHITALATGSTGPLPTRDFGAHSGDPRLNRDVLFVGTQTNLLVYDVEYNSDVFYKEVDYGVNVVRLGTLGGMESPVAVVGGNCNIQGFDVTGTEVFWTVTGDNIGAMAITDIDGDGKCELIVGSDDYDIRVFRNEEVIGEYPEADAITGLYALANGTVGVYEKGKRAWRVKSKNRPVCITGFDLDQDGVPELISGWSNGKLEVRNDNGDLIFKDHFTAPVSAVVTADYRMDGKQELIVCSLEGEVKGYNPTSPGAQGSLLDRNVVEETLVSLNQKRQQLQLEIKNYEEMVAKNSQTGGVPTVAQLTAKIRASIETASQAFVFESVLKLPKFSMFASVPISKVKEPTGKVTFQVSERVARIWMWVRQSFLVESGEGPLNIAFVCLRDPAKRALIISMSDDTITIQTDDMELAGDIIQDLCEFLKITELESTASFPEEMETFKQVVTNVTEFNAARLKLTAEMADCSNLVKTLLIKAEDCRLLGDMRIMKQVYATLYEVNRELIGEYKKRENNQVALMNSLKEMNQTIQKAARLRMGGAKTRIVNSAREAVLANNIQSIFKLIKVGKA
eukprot:m51a1_g5698 putative bardet-biedl syndrome 2 protein homolog (629) ;mRNA; f:1021607-1024075